MEKIEKITNRFGLLLILLFSIPAVWALLVPGYYGASDDIHIAWLAQMHKTIILGQLPPRFVPDLSFGFGYPLFNFVFPLPFYIGEIFHLFGLSFVDSIKAVFFITVPLSGIFMYLLLSQFINKSLSLAGAVLYIYTPYRAVDLYIRGAIGEIVSFVFLPLIILSIVKLQKEKSFKWVGVGGLSLAFLILSHNITAYMFLPFAGLLSLLQLIFHTNKKEYLIKILLLIFLGLLISIYFWLPALIESNLVKYDTVFNFADHFPTLIQLIKPYWGYGASVPGPYDGISFFLGGANILILASGIILFVLRWKKMDKQKKVFIIWGLSAIFIAIFLMNFRSSFLWANLPLLPYFQFPWRFLILTTFFIPMLLIAFDGLRVKFLPVILLIITLLPAVFYFRPQDFLGRTDEYFLNRYIPYPAASEEYKKTQEEYLRLPNNTQIRPDKNYPIIDENLNVKKIISENGLNATFWLELEKGTDINYYKYFFPGWTAEIDDAVSEIKPGSPFGQITFYVPEGSHKIEVAFKETPFKMMLDAISLLSFLVSLGLVKNLWIGSKKPGLSY